MKKLVCLMIVALIGTVASAGIVFSGDLTIPEDTVQAYTIVADIAAENMNVGAIALDKGSALVGTLNALFTTVNDPGQQKDGSVNGIYIFQINATAPTGITVDAGQVLYSFTIDSTGLDVGDIITISEWIGDNPFGMPPFPVSSFFNGDAADLASLAVEVIPEPMTIALLGLGGLFIRRRK